LVELLPTGGALIHVISNFQTPKGIVLENRGVRPDVAVKPTRANLLAGRDTVLQRAIELAASSTALKPRTAL
jgi:C-terminal processing protease CtpA/Prc